MLNRGIWALLTLAGLVAAPPLTLHAQEGAADVLARLRSGGGWVGVPIVAGVGSVSTMRLPTVGMTLNGCVQVWPGHSGDFEIHARDAVSNQELTLRASPGVGVPFSHTFGMQAQVDFRFEWSEPRDTTLMLWVGVAIGKSVAEACEPVYGG